MDCRRKPATLSRRSTTESNSNVWRDGITESIETNLPGYRVLQQIGTGAGSKIFVTKELATGKTYAVKHVVRDSSEDQRFLEQAEVEYKVGNKITHPSLRHIHSIKRIRRRLQVRELILIMEHVDGLDVERARPNRLNTFLTIFRKVAEGLHAMHGAGYLHTDIKPTNILIAKGGLVKIIDFGQSCPIHHRKERIQGTPDFIAPEQVRRLALDRRTDVFNLGATMYWVLTSEKYPTELRGADSCGGISVITSDKPIAPVELNDKIPVSLSKLVMECCSESPADRPADMKQVLARLSVVRKLWTKFREEMRAKNRDSKAASTTGKKAGTTKDDT